MWKNELGSLEVSSPVVSPGVQPRAVEEAGQEDLVLAPPLLEGKNDREPFAPQLQHLALLVGDTHKAPVREESCKRGPAPPHDPQRVSSSA